MKVDFLIGGVQKGGTSALDAYLRLHPGISMAKHKESHFFDDEQCFANSNVDYSLYHSLFDPKSDGCLFGETTPIYMYWHPAPRRIWEYNSRMKWIVLLRNPIARAFSDWNMEWDRNAETLSFREAITSERLRCREAIPLQHRVYSYVDRGFYAEQIRRLWHFFPVEQTFFLKTEDLLNDPRNSLDRVCGFLQLDAFREVSPRIKHSRPYISQMTREELAYLRNVYEYDIKQIERLLGWDCSQWLA
ncbi:MAG: sulfotransferase domain-containing protein [Thermoguttaceae bacterium]